MTADRVALTLAVGAGLLGGATNALAGGGTFGMLLAPIAPRLPATAANASPAVALRAGAAASAWRMRDALAPIAGAGMRMLGGVTFAGALVGGRLLVCKPTRTFDIVDPVAAAVGDRGGARRGGVRSCRQRRSARRAAPMAAVSAARGM